MPSSNKKYLDYTVTEKKFNLKHIFRGGSIVWSKFQGKDYYLVFRSLSRPNRGIQLPGGRIEKDENPAEAIIRETQEETGVEARIVCPLGLIYYESEKDNYSNLQMYYLVRPIFPQNVFKKWRHIDQDQTKQDIECWYVSTDKPTDFLAGGQAGVVEMFKKWLAEHRRNEEELNRRGE